MELNDPHTGFLGPPRKCLRREGLSSGLGDRQSARGRERAGRIGSTFGRHQPREHYGAHPLK